MRKFLILILALVLSGLALARSRLPRRRLLLLK